MTRPPGADRAPATDRTGITLAIGLALVLGVAGVLHLVRPEVFDPLVPPFLGPARPWTIGSGIAEIVVAALLAVPATRRRGGWAAAALLVAVFPGNIWMAIQGHPGIDGDGERLIAVARLPLQVPLVWSALRVARGRWGR